MIRASIGVRKGRNSILILIEKGLSTRIIQKPGKRSGKV